jgi:hypothetical protein
VRIFQDPGPAILLTLCSLITSADQRLGRNGADEIKNHPFFAGVDWNTLRDIEAPFKPQLQSITDTSYFPTDELENVPDAPAVAAMMAQQQANNAGLPEPAAGDSGLPFIGYTYKRLLVHVPSTYTTKTNSRPAMRLQRRLECNLFVTSFISSTYHLQLTRFILDSSLILHRNVCVYCRLFKCTDV